MTCLCVPLEQAKPHLMASKFRRKSAMNSPSSPKVHPAAEMMTVQTPCSSSTRLSTVRQHHASQNQHLMNALQHLQPALHQPATSKLCKAELASQSSHPNTHYQRSHVQSGCLSGCAPPYPESCVKEVAAQASDDHQQADDEGGEPALQVHAQHPKQQRVGSCMREAVCQKQAAAPAPPLLGLVDLGSPAAGTCLVRPI